MTLGEVEKAGLFAWRPGANLVWIPDQGVKVIQVDDMEGRICAIVPAKPILPPWALHGWKHEYACVCEVCEGSIHGE